MEQYQERVLAADSNTGSRLATPDPEAQRRAAERSQQLLARRQGLLQRRTSQAQEQQARLQQLQQEVGWGLVALLAAVDGTRCWACCSPQTGMGGRAVSYLSTVPFVLTPVDALD